MHAMTSGGGFPSFQDYLYILLNFLLFYLPYTEAYD